MKEILAHIASVILLDKAAAELGIDIHEVVCNKVKELANGLPGKNPAGYFTIRLPSGRTESVQVPVNSEMESFKSGKKLEAVKAYKDRTSQSLMNAKTAIEQYN